MRKETRVFLAGAAAAAAWAAGEQVSAVKPVKVGALILLTTALASRVITNGASSKARRVEQRLNALQPAIAQSNNFLANGGTVGGSVVVNGTHTVNGDIHSTGNISNTSGSGNVNTNGTFNGGGATLTGGIDSGGNIQALSGNISDQYQSDIGSTVASLPNWVFSSTKCATVTAIGTGHTVDQVEGMCADVIHSMKTAGHMS